MSQPWTGRIRVDGLFASVAQLSIVGEGASDSIFDCPGAADSHAAETYYPRYAHTTHKRTQGPAGPSIGARHGDRGLTWLTRKTWRGTAPGPLEVGNPTLLGTNRLSRRYTEH